MPPRIIDCSDDSSDNNGIVIVAERPEGSIGIQQPTDRETGSSQGTTRSWVYDHSEKKRKVENRTSSVGWNGRRVGNVLKKCRQKKEIPQTFQTT